MLASSSARSLPGLPECPFTQRQSILCPCVAASSRFQRSSFLTGFLSAVFQPRRFHECIHSEMPFWTYCESVYSTTVQWRFSDSSALMTAISSMRLLVVSGSPP